MIKLFIILTSLISISTSFANLSQVQTDKSRVPLFFDTLLPDLSSSDKNYLTALNENLAAYPPASTKSLFLSQFYKSFYQPWKIKELKSLQTQISRQDLIAAQEKLKKNNLITSKFTEFFLVEIFLTFTEKLDEKNKDKSNVVNKFLSPWIHGYLTMSPPRFKKLILKTSQIYLKNLVKTSQIISFNIKSTTSGAPLLFTNLESINEGSTEPTSSAKDDENTNEKPKVSPQEVVAPLKVDTEDSASKEIDKLIENINN